MLARRQVWIWLLLTFITVVGYAENANREQLLNERRSLEFNLAKIRVKLLQENAELRELNERIIKLQKLLTEKLEEQPQIKFLQNKIDDIDNRLKEQKPEY